jgi:hypothetical protein
MSEAERITALIAEAKNYEGDNGTQRWPGLITELGAALAAAEAREQEAKAIGWDEAVIKTLAAVNGSSFDLAYVAANNPYRSAPTEQEKK